MIKRTPKQKRALIHALLTECTEEQERMFYYMYPEGPDKMKNSKLDTAIIQCETTVHKNWGVKG